MPQAARTLLIEKQRELRDRIGRLEQDQRYANEPVEKDFEEQASQRENDEVVDGLLREARQELSRVEHALGRLAGGTYGQCSACGQPIGAGRLAAMPEATLCIACASARG